MRKYWSVLLAAAMLVACNNSKTPDSPKDKTDDTASATNSANNTSTAAVNLIDKLIGSFVGAFGDNKITLLITKVSGDTVMGSSVVGGNNRPFTGMLTHAGNEYSIVAKEPGDNPDDGVFTFSMLDNSPDSVRGSWKPNNPKKPVKQYVLGRKAFEYKADVGNYPEASTRLLKTKDVENMFKEDLQYMRNEIFARHGYCFKKKDLRQQFEYQDWYVPATTDIKGLLTDIEKKNIELIKRFEKYADEYGDEYGR